MQEILFVIPAKLTRPYFSSLCCECENSIYHRFRDNMRPIWRCVPRETDEFDEEKVIEILQREMRQSRKIGLLVVAPTPSKHLTIGVAEVARKRKIPIIALSLPFHFRGVFRQRGIPIPPVVLCDSAFGTQELGKGASHELLRRRPGIERPHVVLIPGQSHRIDSINRLKNFREGISTPALQPQFSLTQPCNWQRKRARLEMERVIAESKNPIDVVFAANDEMALGARDAIRYVMSDIIRNSIVYGFDAINEVCSLIEDNDYHMKGTIEQDLPQMAESLVNFIKRSLEGEKLGPKDSVLIKPKCVFPKLTEVRLDLAKRWPNVPHLDSGTEDWVSESETAKIEAVGQLTLRDYRKRNQKARVLYGGNLGMDRFGRIWRRDSDKRVFYLLPTLGKVAK